MSLWSSIREWCVREATPRFVKRIEPAYVQPRTSGAQAVAGNCYLRVKMVQMVLAQDRRWFKDQQASVHSLVKLRYADRDAIEVPNILAANPALYAPGASVFTNSTILPLTPFRGGEVDLEIALVAVPGDDRLANGIKALSNVASLIATPLSGALAVAAKIKESGELLVGAGSQIHLAYRNTFNGDPGAAQLTDGYMAIVNAAAGSFGQLALVVDHDELRLWDNIQARPVHGVDYMLLRIEVLEKRDDLASFKDLEDRFNAAISAFITADAGDKKANAERLYREALAAIQVHPELINADRRRLAQQLQSDLAPYRSADSPAQLLRSTRQRWSQFVATLPEESDNRDFFVEEFLPEA